MAQAGKTADFWKAVDLAEYLWEQQWKPGQQKDAERKRLDSHGREPVAFKISVQKRK